VARGKAAGPGCCDLARDTELAPAMTPGADLDEIRSKLEPPKSAVAHMVEKHGEIESELWKAAQARRLKKP
jgi:hypothetical protein